MWTNRISYDTSTPFLISTSQARTASLITPRSVTSRSSSFFTGFFLVLTEIEWRIQNISPQAIGFKEIRVVTAFKPHGPSGNFGFREATSALRELPERPAEAPLMPVCCHLFPWRRWGSGAAGASEKLLRAGPPAIQGCSRAAVPASLCTYVSGTCSMIRSHYRNHRLAT